MGTGRVQRTRTLSLKEELCLLKTIFPFLGVGIKFAVEKSFLNASRAAGTSLINFKTANSNSAVSMLCDVNIIVTSQGFMLQNKHLYTFTFQHRSATKHRLLKDYSNVTLIKYQQLRYQQLFHLIFSTPYVFISTLWFIQRSGNKICTMFAVWHTHNLNPEYPPKIKRKRSKSTRKDLCGSPKI